MLNIRLAGDHLYWEIALMVSFCAVLFPRDVLAEILNLTESVSGGFPTYSVACNVANLAFWNFSTILYVCR